jgi:fucose permease
VVFGVEVLFMRTPLPEIAEEENSIASRPSAAQGPLMKQRHFVLAVVAQFAYVAAQTGVFSYLINFITDENQQPHFDKMYGPYFLSIGFALFMIGRMTGSYFMSFVKPAKLLAAYSLACGLLLAVLLMAAKYNVPVCPHAGGVGLCEYVQHLAMIDYICVSGALENRVIEFVDHLHEHFLDPVTIKDGAYMPPALPGYSIEMKAESLKTYSFPDGAAWKS